MSSSSQLPVPAARPWTLGARPRFSFGQLLTDSDLTALVEWSESKSQLARLRHGWGVVCGMDVSAGSDGEVMVDVGYAVDAAGRDVLIAEPVSFALDTCCAPGPVGCAAAVSTPALLAQAAFGEVEERDLRVFDLGVQYAEQSSEPRSVLGGVNGRAGARREYARTRTLARIVCTPVASDSDPLEAEVKAWEQDYGECLAVVRRYREEVGAAHAGGRAWLLAWMDEHRPRHFPFVRRWVEEHAQAEWSEKHAVHALFWLAQDARNGFLHAACPWQVPDAAVPLARVWVRSAGATTQRGWRVVSVDAQPPFRRLLQDDKWPARLHEINLGRVVWRRVEEAQKLVSMLGLRPNDPDPFELPHTAEALEAELGNHKMMVGADAVVKLQYFNAGDLGFRVVGVRS